MTTTTDKYLVEISAKIIGDEAFKVLTARMAELQRQNEALKRSLSGSGAALDGVRRAGGNAAAGLGKMGMLWQNLSYQVTDFAVQTSGGVDALRAFSQQAPQVAGALGAAGIGGAFGIAGLAVASLVAALAPAIATFFQTGQAAKSLNDQLKDLQENRLDLSSLIVNQKQTVDDFAKLTKSGKEFAAAIIEMQRRTDQSAFKVLQQQLGELTKELQRWEGVDLFPSTQGGMQNLLRDIKNLEDEFGLSAMAAAELAPLIRQITDQPLGEGTEATLNRISDILSSARDDSPEVNARISEIIGKMTELAQVAQQLGGFDFSVPEDEPKKVTNIANQWESILKSVRNSNEEFEAQIKLVNDIGAKLSKPKEEIDFIISRLSDRRAADLFKELAADTETMSGGMVAAVQAIDQMGPSLEYLAGIRQMMNQAANEEQWAAIAQLLKDAATPAEKVRLAMHEIRQEASNNQDLREAFDEFVKGAKLSQKETELLEKRLFGLKEKGTDAIDSIGIAIGNTLSTHVGNFVDTLFDAEASFTEMAQSMLRDIAKLITQMIILAQLKAALAGTGFGDFLGITGSAKGNVFINGAIQPFANGGIVDRPTIFPMANGIGLMGEAGPEAIMPLSRGADGKLGVKSQPVTVNVYNASGGTARVEKSQDSNGALRIDVMIEGAVDSAISRGRFDKSLNSLYGLRRRGA